MVTRKSNRAAYSLAEINRIAAAGNVRFDTRKAQNDADNLDYSSADVCACLRDLLAADYRHTVRYDDEKNPHDVYQCEFSPPSNPAARDSLYIKLRLNRDRNEISLTSFHLS